MEDNNEISEEDKLRKRVEELEGREAELIKERDQLEEDFGHRRAKLKDMYLQKEEELRMQSDKSSLVLVETEELRDQVLQLQRELEEARSEVTIAQCTAENSVAVEQRKCQEEIATLQQLMKEEVASAVEQSSSKYEDDIKKFRKLSEKLENEKQHYRNLYEQKIEEVEGRSRGDSLLAPGMLSAVTKSLAKRVPSLSPAHSVTTPDKPPSSTPASPPQGGSLEATSPPATDENLEIGMRKAQEDAAVLRSLLVPLEEEIAALKNKIREQDTQLRAYEARMDADIQTSDVLGPLLEGRPVAEVVQDLDQRLKGVSSTLEAEKSSRVDLEFYTAILHSQKAAMSKELDAMKTRIKETIDSLEQERRQHRELKDTWLRANDQFLASQRCHLQEMGKLREIMNAEQLVKLQEIEGMAEEDWPDVQPLPRSVPASPEEVETEEEELVDTDTETKEGALDARYSPEKMPVLSEEQEKALQGTPESGVEYELKEAAVDNCRSVSEKEWRALMLEVKRARTGLNKACPGCAKLEQKLKESEKTIKDQEGAIKRQREDLDQEATYRKHTEAKWKEQAEDFERREQALRKLTEQSVRQHKELSAWKATVVKKIEEKVSALADKRVAVQRELERLQHDNDTLIGKHSQHSRELQNEIINLPDNSEDMQLLLLRYREDVIAAKVAKEHIEEKSNSKIQFLRSQLDQEQHERSSIEEKLTGELDQCRAKLEEMSRMVGRKEVVEKQLSEVQHKFQETSNKNQQMITVLKAQMSDMTLNKTKMEQELSEAKSKVSTLQHDLGNSEAVQRDFVRLSQSLQVQLEMIRQSEKEVRWQHDDDVDDCNNCKQRFSTTRRKHNCKHCGKIFCPDCLSKSVPSGPKSRLQRVCDVCHTLLVQDATPYFSTEPPQSPG